MSSSVGNRIPLDNIFEAVKFIGNSHSHRGIVSNTIDATAPSTVQGNYITRLCVDADAGDADAKEGAIKLQS